MDSFTVLFPLSAAAHQLTVAVKDSIDIAGAATQLSSPACDNHPDAQKDAVVVQRLKQAGFRLRGKTVMHELAFGMTGVNAVFGTPMNPLYPNLIPGGSSSGSATAVAAGDVDVALGTDTGGSVRVPAACCGIYGLKTTFGLVSREGVWPANSSLDCVGVFAQTPQLIAATMQAIAPVFQAQTLTDDRYTLGWLDVDADNTIASTVKSSLLACPALDLTEIRLPSFGAAFDAGMTIINRETWLACKDFYATGKLGNDVAERLEKASQTTEADVWQAEQVCVTFTRQVDNALEHVAALALPTLPHMPMTREQALSGQADLTLSKLVRPFNLSGHPAITVPCPNALHIPMGIQLVGRKDDDAFLCALAERLAQSLDSQAGV